MDIERNAQENASLSAIIDIFKADQNDKGALKRLGLARRVLIFFIANFSAVHNEFKFENEIWNYEKFDYGPYFVPKNQQASGVTMYSEESMP